MPNTTGICSSGPRPSGRRGLRPNGWPIMDAASTMSARRWIGPFRQTATRRSGSLSPPPQRGCGDSCRCRRSATGTSTERSRALHPAQSRRSAGQHIERMLARYVAPVRRSHTIRFLYDQRVVAAAYLARILWLQGFPDRAMSTVQSIVGGPPVIGHARSVALAQAACPISLLVGDLPATERAVATLLDEAARHALAIWHAWGRAFEGILFIKRGDAVNGLALLRTAQGELRETGFAALYTEILRALAEALADAGEVAEGLVTIDEALARSERDEERWCFAELLRIKGELLLLQAGLNAVVIAEDHFRQAIDWAGRQSALSWELRAATSLARLWREQARNEEARELLAPIYARFTEGFETADLRAAKALIDDLQK